MWTAEIKLDDTHRLVENSFGAFIQRRRGSLSLKRGAGSRKPTWTTVSMHQGLDEAFLAWEVLTGTQTAVLPPSEAVLDPFQGVGYRE